MPEIIDTLRARIKTVRQKLRKDRAEVLQQAMELLGAGLETEEVYLELRDRYLDSIPVIADAGDRAVDWSQVIQGAGGDLLEAIDGKIIDTLLRLIVRAADARHQRRQKRIVTLGDVLARGGRPDAPLRDVTPEPVAEPDGEGSRSGALAGWDDGMNGAI